MKISSSLSDIEIKTLVQEFYEYFNRPSTSEIGHAFESFLREYLSNIGLDEVEITQRSRDGGIDLTALRRGVGDFSDTDITYYYIQAKRNTPSSSIPVTKVRELKGTIPFGHKGIFITTAKFSNDAIREAANDPSKPIVLISGKQLVINCIDNEIGFVYKPIFSKSEMDSFTQFTVASRASDAALPTSTNVDYIEKRISENDIRTRIVRIPSGIISRIDTSITTLQVSINDDDQYQFNIDRSRTYFGGVMVVYK